MGESMIRSLTYLFMAVLCLLLIASVIQYERICVECDRPCYSESLLTRWIGAEDKFVHEYCVSNSGSKGSPREGYYSVSYATGEEVFRKIEVAKP